MESGFASFRALMHCGVYMLVRRGEVVYIGQSKSLGNRLQTHVNSRKRGNVKVTGFVNQVKTGIQFDDIWVQPCMMGELDTIEISMIKKYQPKYNVLHKDRPKPEIPIEELIAQYPLLEGLPAQADAIEERRTVHRRF